VSISDNQEVFNHYFWLPQEDAVTVNESLPAEFIAISTHSDIEHKYSTESMRIISPN
jgi:hypothetical protein